MITIPVEEGVTIKRGALVGTNSDGYAVPVGNILNSRFAGVALDNQEGDTIRVARRDVILMVPDGTEEVA